MRLHLLSMALQPSHPTPKPFHKSLFTLRLPRLDQTWALSGSGALPAVRPKEPSRRCIALLILPPEPPSLPHKPNGVTIAGRHQIHGADVRLSRVSTRRLAWEAREAPRPSQRATSPLIAWLENASVGDSEATKNIDDDVNGMLVMQLAGHGRLLCFAAETTLVPVRRCTFFVQVPGTALRPIASWRNPLGPPNLAPWVHPREPRCRIRSSPGRDT